MCLLFIRCMQLFEWCKARNQVLSLVLVLRLCFGAWHDAIEVCRRRVERVPWQAFAFQKQESSTNDNKYAKIHYHFKYPWIWGLAVESYAAYPRRTCNWEVNNCHCLFFYYDSQAHTTTTVLHYFQLLTTRCIHSRLIRHHSYVYISFVS
jgi:hypothetical protein